MYIVHSDVLTRFGWLVFMSAFPPNEWLLKEQLNNNEPRPCWDHFSHLPQWAHQVSLNYSSPQKIMKSISISLFQNIRQSWFFPWPYWTLWDGNGHDLQCLGENSSPLKCFAVHFETFETCIVVISDSFATSLTALVLDGIKMLRNYYVSLELDMSQSINGKSKLNMSRYHLICQWHVFSWCMIGWCTLQYFLLTLMALVMLGTHFVLCWICAISFVEFITRSNDNCRFCCNFQCKHCGDLCPKMSLWPHIWCWWQRG